MIHAEIGSVQLLGGCPQRVSSPQVTLFCDFDGPIVDVSERYYHTYQLGLAEIEAAFPHLTLHQLSKAQFWQMKQERTPDIEIAMRCEKSAQVSALAPVRGNANQNNQRLRFYPGWV